MDHYLREVVEELRSIEEQLFVLIAAWSGTRADKEAEIAVTCRRMYERTKAVREALEAVCKP